MADFLLELFSEEIPARMQVDAIEHLQNALQKGLGVSKSEAFSTPRRLAIIIKDLPEKQADISTELKGPKVDAPEAAVNGFLKKNNLTLEQLENRGGVYFANIHQKGKATAEILKSAVEEVLLAFPWPKSMCWGSGAQNWVRPLHNILCIFDGKIVPVEFAGLTANNQTFGHRFLAPDAITINSPDEYASALENAFVFADREKRKNIIAAEIEKAATAKNLKPKADIGLLEEVVGLVEYPKILLGKIDDKFMDLPPEVLTMVMRSHQKYFALQNADGTLSPYFVITSNMTTDDGGKAIIAGNERVLRARFADARFFWDTDRNKKLSDWAEGLKTVTYHAKLGTVAEKVERIKALAEFINSHGSWVMGHGKENVIRAAELCKADLVTGMVGEFAELQGTMGRYYAMQQKEAQEVADAIRDHYKPVGANDSVPTSPVSVCVALADKLDTLISMFAIGEKPTGSKDPFALRRAALGVIKIILENNLRLNLREIFKHQPSKTIALNKARKKLVEKTEAKLHDQATTGKHIGKYVSVSETAYEDISEEDVQEVVNSLMEFFIERLKVMLREQNIRHDVISAVIARDDDLVRVVARAKALQEFIVSENGSNLLAAYKRAANILSAEEKKDGVVYGGAFEASKLKEAEEKNLASLLEKSAIELDALKKSEKFADAMTKLAEIRKPLDEFFEKIMVNCEDKTLREQRLRLLANLREVMNNIANFAVIEG